MHKLTLCIFSPHFGQRTKSVYFPNDEIWLWSIIIDASSVRCSSNARSQCLAAPLWVKAPALFSDVSAALMLSTSVLLVLSWNSVNLFGKSIKKAWRWLISLSYPFLVKGTFSRLVVRLSNTGNVYIVATTDKYGTIMNVNLSLVLVTQQCQSLAEGIWSENRVNSVVTMTLITYFFTVSLN